MKLPLHLESTLINFNIPIKQFDIDKVINVYTFGSQCYSTHTQTSDIDYIIIYDNDNDISDTIITKVGDHELNATLISPKYFQELIDANDIKAIECLFLKTDNSKEDWSFESVEFNFKIIPEKLRHSISSVASNSWVKCKKKIEQGDILIGQKSLFHSLRILDFGIQIMKKNQITFEFSYSNTLSSTPSYRSLLKNIKNISDWDTMKKKFKPIYNSIRTEFKLLTPKK